MRVLAEGLVDLGLLPVQRGRGAGAEQSTVYRRWTLHGFGHMLGMDVHDCALARQETYHDGTLGEGYVLTVEPGLYFQPDDDLVPEELRGIGVRIEDDVLVTADRRGNLSAGLPRARRRGRDLARRAARGRPPPARLTPAPPFTAAPPPDASPLGGRFRRRGRRRFRADHPADGLLVPGVTDRRNG